MSNNKITGLAAASSNGECVRYEELQTVSTTANSKLPLSGGTMTGQLVLGNHLNAGGFQLTNIASATGGNDALQYNQANNMFVKLTGSTMTGNLSHDNASDFLITGGSGKNGSGPMALSCKSCLSLGPYVATEPRTEAFNSALESQQRGHSNELGRASKTINKNIFFSFVSGSNVSECLRGAREIF